MSTPSTENDEIRRLFTEHVPEIASGAVEIKGIARERGRQVLVAVHASDPGVCPVSSCVGRRGDRVKTVVKVLSGERVDIVRWSESLPDYIRNLLGLAKVEEIVFDNAAHRATVTVSGDLTSLTRDGGIRLRLASRVAGWDLQLIET